MYVALKKTAYIWKRQLFRWIKKKDWMERMTIKKYRKELRQTKEAMKKARLEGSEYIDPHTLETMMKNNEEIPMWIQNKALF